MTQYDDDEEMVGEEFDDDEVEAMLEEMGISGEDAEELIGRRRTTRRRRWPRRRIRRNSGNRPRQMPFLMSSSIALADGGTATLTGTADRRALLTAMYLEGNDAAGAIVAGIILTGLTVNGRNAVVGSGSIPARLAFGEFGQAGGGDSDARWSLGIVEQGGAVNVDVTNASGAAADVYCGFRAETTD